VLPSMRNIVMGLALALPFVGTGCSTNRDPQTPSADSYSPSEAPPPLTLRDRLSGMIYGKVEPNEAEKEALRRMIKIMPELAGADGFFNLGDIGAITDSLQGKKIKEGVKAEDLKPWTGVKATIARTVATGQLKKGLEENGVTADAPDTRPHRLITVAQLQQYGEDSDLLKDYRTRCKEAGMPEVTFPKGISADDLRAILHGQTPPNGVVKW